MESTLGAPPTGNHVYEHQKTEATCEQEGSEWDVCKGCGQKINVTVIPSRGGHKFDKEVTDHPASCDGFGYGHMECSVCGKRGQGFDIPAGRHKWVEECVNPTCTAYGYTKRYCSKCDRSEEIAGTRVAKSEHTYTVEVTPASCESDEITTKRCSVCGHTEQTITGNRTGHSFGAPVTAERSTCQNEGKVEYRCSKCGSVKEAATPKSDHRWVLGAGRSGLDHCADCGTGYPGKEE